GLLPPLASAGAVQSCRESAGADLAERYVRQCTKVSPATHPPCNAQNPCDEILAEVYRGCRLLTAAERPDFCGPETGTKPRSPPEVVPGR
ncbi:MAG TPA: hypothetical protein VJ779_15965, partial [Acetobacteraceae bacterium]|nr:hypothetical protein [Acetobacteraceae bacterium]